MTDFRILSSAGLFGVETTRKDARIILQQVPWEVTTSYGSGTSHGPGAILEASPQIDLFDIEFGAAYKAGFHLLPEPAPIRALNDQLKPVAQAVIAEWDEVGDLKAKAREWVEQVNTGSRKMVEHVYSVTKTILAEGKIPGLIGGDHSTPLGAIQALCEHYQGKIGVLHIDAHADLRVAYHGFEHSHASIMYNVSQLPTPPNKIIQLGIRDFCKEEYDITQSNPRFKTYFDRSLKERLYKGQSWHHLCEEIISQLPENVYISFDIDGLSPEFCPSTGTPVPGGLSFDQASYLLSLLGKSWRKIVGFDLNEVAPGPEGGQWDGNVGSRLLFKMCGWTAVTQGWAKVL